MKVPQKNGESRPQDQNQKKRRKDLVFRGAQRKGFKYLHLLPISRMAFVYGFSHILIYVPLGKALVKKNRSGAKIRLLF